MLWIATLEGAQAEVAVKGFEWGAGSRPARVLIAHVPFRLRTFAPKTLEHGAEVRGTAPSRRLPRSRLYFASSNLPLAVFANFSLFRGPLLFEGTSCLYIMLRVIHRLPFVASLFPLVLDTYRSPICRRMDSYSPFADHVSDTYRTLVTCAVLVWWPRSGAAPGFGGLDGLRVFE